MNNTFECMLQFLLQTIGLQNINDADEQQQSFAFLTACWNTARSTH